MKQSTFVSIAKYGIAVLAVLFFSSFSLHAQQIDFGGKLEVDYGTIEKGANGVSEFKFTNKGTAPLVISNAQGSCGCTVPTYPKEPIMPGASNVIKVKYDTNRVGPFTKYITITTNDPNNAEVRLKVFGDVKDIPVTVPTEPQAPAPKPAPAKETPKKKG